MKKVLVTKFKIRNKVTFVGYKDTIKGNKMAILRNSQIEIPLVGYKVAIMRNKFANEKYKVRNKVAITRNTAT